MLWLTGVLYGVSGIIVYIEYGLSVPRHMVNGKDIAIPRSGGDLNYVLLSRSSFFISNLVN
jgi:hypothetical protein